MFDGSLALLLVAGVAGESGCTSPPAHLGPLRLAHHEPVPTILVGGAPARIHTQGLYVTDAHFHVTGRLEIEPKRSLFLRVDRGETPRVEFIDLTPVAMIRSRLDDALDHPGGFDFDGDAFWIPVSASRPHSETAVVRVRARPDEPLSQAEMQTVFHVDDHIGALACDRRSGRLYGANWDTETVYVWTRDGVEVERIARDALTADDSGSVLAVQDWKCLGVGRILAGGIDKSEHVDPSRSRAVVALLDLRRRVCLDQVRLTAPPGCDGHVTREGLAVHDGSVYLLPADLGRDAKVYRYRWPRLTGFGGGG